MVVQLGPVSAAQILDEISLCIRVIKYLGVFLINRF